MDISEKFESALFKKAKVLGTQQKVHPNVYIFKCIFDGVNASSIDYEAFTLEDIESVENELSNNSYDEDSEMYELHSENYAAAREISHKEYAVVKRFMDDTYPRKERKVSFL